MRLVLKDIRDDERHQAIVSLLFCGEVAKPVSQEGVDVVEEGSGWREDGEIAGPAEAFVALRAVGRNVKEVAAHPPCHIRVQLVEQRV